MNIFESTVLTKAEVTRDSELAKTVIARGIIFDMTQTAEDAVLRPRNPGAFGQGLRAALAARVAHLAGDDTLAAHYLEDAGDYAALTDPDETGATPWLEVIIKFVDKNANHTRDVVAEDVAALQNEGISDADIVRLCELVAFLAYQARVIAGLRLMQETTT
ncbi:MAG: hypothetical protein ABJI96_18885 [Paracoccaceae bacterium]